MTDLERKCRALPVGGSRTACFAEMYLAWNTKESPRNSNHGYLVDFFNREAGCYVWNNPETSVAGDGNPWCASFLSYLLRFGYNSWDVNTCGTGRMVELYALNRYPKKSHNVYPFSGGAYKIYPGDLLYRQRPNGGVGKGHVGVVVATGTYSFATIEGNTKCQYEANDCVRKRYYYKNGTPIDADNQSAGAWELILRW